MKLGSSTTQLVAERGGRHAELVGHRLDGAAIDGRRHDGLLGDLRQRLDDAVDAHELVAVESVKPMFRVPRLRPMPVTSMFSAVL